MPEENKIEMVNLLGSLNIPLIEDDSLGELHYHTAARLPAKAYDTYDNVQYCSSFSKSLAPGFRIGWVSAGKYHQEIEKLKFGSNISTNTVLQDGIGRYLESGQFDKHIRKMRIAIQSQMVKYMNAVIEYFPSGAEIIAPQGGFSLWIALPSNIDAFDLQKAALANGIGICPGHIFSSSDFFNNYIRINYCPIWNHKVECAIKLIGKLIKSSCH